MSNAIGLSIILIPLLIWGFFMIFFVLALGFWIWMLVDCIQREFPKQDDKILWLIIIIFGNWIGAIVYYAIIKHKPQQ